MASVWWDDTLRILFLNDNRAHPNWGAQATPHAMDVLFEATLPDWERSWLSWDWLRTKHRRFRPPLPRGVFSPPGAPAVRLLLAYLSREERFFPEVADDFDRFADEWLAGGGGPMAAHFMAELDQSDVLVYNGENSLYRNTVEGMRALFLLWLSKTRLGKPTCIVNHTVHLTGALPLMNAMVRKVHPSLDVVTCREAASYRLLKSMGIDNAILVPDVVFWLEERDDACARVGSWLAQNGLEAGGYVCMSASGLPVSRPRGKSDGAYTDLVREIQRRSGLRAVLIARDPHCQFLEEAARRTGAVYFGPSHHFAELWPLLRQAAALVTGHFHYAIIASIGGCPFVPLSANNHKISGLCEMLEWDPVEPFDVTDLLSCGDTVAGTLLELLGGRDKLSARLGARAASLRGRLPALPGLIRQAAGGGQ